MSAAISTITSKGQITIPKSIRDILHLCSGDKVEFVFNDSNQIMIKPVTRKAADVAGILGKYKKEHVVSVEEMNDGIKQRMRDIL